MKREIVICLIITCLFSQSINQNLKEEDIEEFETYKDLVSLGATEEILEYYKTIELLTDYMGSITDLLYLPENLEKYFDMTNKMHDIDAIIKLSTNKRLINHTLNPKIAEILQNSSKYLLDTIKDLISNLTTHNFSLKENNFYVLPPLPKLQSKR
jgi:hypothetical protein